MKTISIIEKLEKNHTASRKELVFLLDGITADEREILRKAAQKRALESFGNRVYIRGLIEISSVCKNDCLYCGLRRSNPNAVRYRLTPVEVSSGKDWDRIAIVLNSDEGIPLSESELDLLAAAGDPFFSPTALGNRENSR